MHGPKDIFKKKFWFVFMLDSNRMFVKCHEEGKLVNVCSFQQQTSLLVTVKAVGSASRDLVN